MFGLIRIGVASSTKARCANADPDAEDRERLVAAEAGLHQAEADLAHLLGDRGA